MENFVAVSLTMSAHVGTRKSQKFGARWSPTPLGEGMADF